MSFSKRIVAVGSLALLLSASAQAQLTFSAGNSLDSTLFNGMGGWTSGDLTIPNGGTAIGTTPVEFDVDLSGDLTLSSVGLGYNYGFGMGGFTPFIPAGDDAFTFSIELLENGVLVPGTPTFADDLANPFTFGFDEPNVFSVAIDNESVTTSTTHLPASITFNEVAIQATTAFPGGYNATDFSVQLGVLLPAIPVPDSSTTLALFSLALAGMIGCGVWGHRKAAVQSRV